MISSSVTGKVISHKFSYVTKSSVRKKHPWVYLTYKFGYGSIKKKCQKETSLNLTTYKFGYDTKKKCQKEISLDLSHLQL